MFNQMLEAIGHKNIRVIRGSWASEGLMTTNYEVYMKNLATTTMCESEAALVEFGVALELDPLGIPAYHNRGRVHEVMGNVDAAIEDYRTALRYDGSYEPARRALERLGVGSVGRAATTPEEIRAAELLREAEASIKRGDYDAAESLCAEAVQLAPDVAAVYQQQANVAFLKGDRAGAERALEKALKLEPDNALFLENLRRLQDGS